MIRKKIWRSAKVFQEARLRDILFLFLSLAPVVAWSDQLPLTPELRDVTQVPTSSQPVGFQRIRIASISTDHGCSGTFISNHGHILTALHCFPLPFGESFPKSRVFISEAIPPGHPAMAKDQQTTVYVSEFDPQTGAQTDLPSRVGKIAVFGKGYLTGFDPVYSYAYDQDTYSKIVREGYSKAEDFVIVDSGLENTPCVPVAKANADIGDEVYYIGRPAKPDFFKIQGRPLWSGTMQAFSIGKVVDGFTDTPSGQDFLKYFPDQAKDPKTRDYMKSGITTENSFMTSLDGFPGSSGSGMLNSAGELVGVLNASSGGGWDNAPAYRPGVLGGVKIEHVIDTAKAQLTPSEFSSTFDCKVP